MKPEASVTAASHDVLQCAKKLRDVYCEFADDPHLPGIIGDYLEALATAVEHLRVAEAAVDAAQPWKAEGRKPTIDELEAILSSPEQHNIEILADGSIRSVPVPSAA